MWAKGQDDLCVHLIIQRVPESSNPGRLQRLRELVGSLGLIEAMWRVVFSLYLRVEALLTLRNLSHHQKQYEVAAEVERQLAVTPIVSKSGMVHRFSEDDLARIRALDLDIMIRCGARILKGGILTSARHGVLSMHHADNRENRGGPAAFWEVYERRPYTGFIIQRLTEELDGGEVLFRGSVATEPFYLRNQVVVSERSAVHLQNMVRRVLAGSVVPEEPALYYGPLYKHPRLGVGLRYILRSMAAMARILVRKKLGIHERWSVAYLTGPWQGAVLRRRKAIRNPPDHFLADPFAVSMPDGRRFIFVEDYVYTKGKAVISAYEVDESQAARLVGTALEEDFHLSFPFVFRHEGEIYMCPETGARGQIRLYRCVSFPLQWELRKVLVDGVRAVDTMIFPHGGKWWMLTCINQSGLGSASDLYVYHSASPLGEWEPVASNPVIADASRGRNGGLLWSGSRIFRVAQRPGFALYGRACSIYRIDRLDEDGYEETLVQDVEPCFDPGIAGIHHLHQDGDLLVFDFVRNERAR